MMSRRSLLAAPIAIALSMLTIAALAQDVTAPMPQQYTAPDAVSPPEQIPDSTAVLDDDESSFAIPLPGGGEIQVNGPASETPATIGPIEHWATQRNNPFSVGTGPLGPIAPPR